MAARNRSLYLHERIWKQLKEEGIKQDRSVNWLIARAISEYLERRKEGSANEQ